ncbi:MAG TPA: FAD-binding oxidoreductase [Polyangiales bacterium]
MSFQEATLERVERLTPRISSFSFRSTLAAHLAGQHVDVLLTAPDGYTAQRSYSIASAPGSELLELAIERVNDGEVSSFFHEAAEVGDKIALRGPLGGHFVWRGDDVRPLLLVAGGSGIAPLTAIARHRARTAPGTPCLIVYSAQTWEDLAYRDELLASNATVRLITTRGEKHRDSDYERRIDRALLAEILDSWQQTPANSYVCGSTPFVENVTSALVELGLPPGSVRAERYGGVLPSY